MKIPELREKLSGLSEKELIYLAVEFYKLIPKAKREMYQLDAMTAAPDPASKPPKLQGSTDSIADMEHKIIEFVKNAAAGYYFRYNTVVSRKVRKAWRSTLKSWFKALISTNRPEADLNKQAELLISLYLLLHRGTRTKTFTSSEPFEAINVEQTKFYSSVLNLLEHASGKSEVINKGIPLMLDSIDGKVETTYLIDEFLLMIRIPDLYEQTIEKIQSMIIELNEEREKAVRTNKIGSEYWNKYKSKINLLAELGLRVYVRLGEHSNGFAFYESTHLDNLEETKLYYLIKYLYKESKPDLIVQAIEAAISKGIKPRMTLRELFEYIQQNYSLPERLF